MSYGLTNFAGSAGGHRAGGGLNPLARATWLLFDRQGNLSPLVQSGATSMGWLFDQTGTLRARSHNLLLWSEQFDNAVWTKASSSITANRFVPVAGLSSPAILQTPITGVAGAEYTVSVEVSPDGTNKFLMIQYDGDLWNGVSNSERPRVWFDPTTGQITATQRVLASGVESLAGGRFRVWLRARMTTAGSIVVRIGLQSTSGTTAGYTGDGTSGIFIWGAQLNQGELQPYYPTTGAAYYGPRVSYDPANLSLGPFLLAEEARTNAIRNNTMQGAVAGTPGTGPTNWVGLSSSDGLTRTIVGTGTEDGITYIDIRWQGTLTSAFNGTVLAGATSVIAANGQTWTGSWFVRIVGGSLTGFNSMRLQVTERMADSALVTNGNTSITPTTAALRQQRFVLTRTLAGGATVERVSCELRANASIGAAIDITLRIGLPQLELGATASSPILTYGSAVTRSADNLSVTNLAATGFNASEGTLYAHWLSDMPAGTGLGFVATLTDNAASSASRQLGIQSRSLNSQIRVWQSSVGVGPAGGLDESVAPVWTAWSGKAAIRWGGGQNVSAAANASAIVTMANAIESTSFNSLIIGAAAGGFPLQGRIYQAAIIPQLVSDSGLQRMTRI